MKNPMAVGGLLQVPGLLYWDRNRGTHRLYTTNDGLSSQFATQFLRIQMAFYGSAAISV
ncbi:MAG: hypothetical protein R2792_01615 [Saprospiraceae bacterium]